MSAVILGINFSHADSSVALFKNGLLIAAIAEERLGERKKHDSRFPVNALKQVLQSGSITLDDIDYVAVGRDPKANLTAKIGYSLRQPIESFGAVKEFFRRNKETSKKDFFMANTVFGLGSFKGKVVQVEHHIGHIASAYYGSGLSSALGFSYDGSGDFCSAMFASCDQNYIRPIKRCTLPDSLGFFYSAVCQLIGFKGFGEEFKVMGLSAYGEDLFAAEMNLLVGLSSDGLPKLNSKFFKMHAGGVSGARGSDGRLIVNDVFQEEMVSLFGGRAKIDANRANIARSLQVRFEEIVVKMLRANRGISSSDSLAVAGGCALNGLTNTRICNELGFKNVVMHPAAGDDGIAIGAALYVWHTILRNPIESSDLSVLPYAGPIYECDAVRGVAKKSKFYVKTCASRKELVSVAAHLIADGKVVGWYQGRSEWGPRALGNRSILADPSNPVMKDLINQKIKRRENFRPFAPSVLEEMASEYFEIPTISPYMMHVVPLREQYRSKLPAITHVDGTGRIQTVNRENNELYYDLIKAVGDLTGIYMVLNTSFNENEPVVERAEEALSCFERTEMDVLFLFDALLEK